MQYSSIQAAVDAASAGYTVMVYSGTYRENVAVNKPLTLIGVDNGGGKPAIDGTNNGANAVNIRANGVTIDGFKVQGGYYGIFNRYANNTRIINCTVTNASTYAVYLLACHNATIAGSTVTDNKYQGIKMEEVYDVLATRNAITYSQYGIEVYRGDNVTISYNYIDHNHGSDIVTVMTNHSLIKGNTVNTTWNQSGIPGGQGDANGIGSMYSHDTIIEDNVVGGDHYYGIKVYYSSNITVHNNYVQLSNIRLDLETHDSVVSDNYVIGMINHMNCIFLNNTVYNCTVINNTATWGRQGIEMRDTTNNTIANNTCYNLTYGLRLTGTAKNNVFRDNSFSDNLYGVYLEGSKGNTFYLNDLLGNSGPVYTTGGGTATWNSTSQITYTYNGSRHTNYLGNRYSVYKGTDANGDGVGSTAYIISGVNDSYPLMQTHDKYIESSSTPTPTVTPTATPIPTPTVTVKPTTTPTATPTPSPSPTATPSPSKVVTVGQGMQYSSIQAAVDAASAGYTVMVYSGTYRENLAVNKPLTLIGVDNGGGKPVIDGTNNGANAVNIRASGVVVDGFTIKNGYSGIDISGVGGTIVRNCEVTGNTNHGLYLQNSNNNVISGNNVSDNALSITEGDTKNAVMLYQSSGNTIRGNVMSGGMYGITLDDSWHNTLESNTVSGSTYNDMVLANASYNTIKENKMSNSGAGLQISNSAGNTIYLNDFLDGIYSAGSGNTWYSPKIIAYSYNGKSCNSRLGNRYSDYSGQDKNGDGVGTQKYNKNGIRDNYPLMDTHEKFIVK